MAPLPAEILGRLAPSSRVAPLDGREGIWRIDGGAVGRAVLRRRPAPSGVDPAIVEGHVRWVHQFLHWFQSDHVTVPRPVDLLSGSAVTTVGGATWETVTYLPGRTVGWSRRTTMTEIGALIARFHNIATEQVAGEPGVGHNIPVLDLVEPNTWSGARVNEHGFAIVRRALDDLEAGLDRINHVGAPVTAIHGDLTSHNVLASGQPPAPSGLIDFSNCYREAALADIGFGLWRSGRPSQNAHRFDAARIAACLTGYRSARPTQPDVADAVIVYLLARGLQIAAKQCRQNHDIGPPLTTRLAWLHDHANKLRDDVRTRLQAAK